MPEEAAPNSFHYFLSIIWGIIMPVMLYDDGNHKCIAFSDLVTCGDEAEQDSEYQVCDGVQATQFLIINNDHAALIDPGG
ncbi:MAG: hypothetical protein GWN00_07240, partial [Aliifodinibius sp.]|nr:hypothetical protein [Fodinibius sp.]NIV11023.1 hypothetical protein [Fodinibius sp.]NIY24610.1 hypothetical protein [Fodinibius sp.]